MTNPQARLRAICLAFPEATEVVLLRPSVWCKAPPGAQQFEIKAMEGRYFAPPYYGPKGWLGAWLDGETDWDDVRSLIERSYLLRAQVASRSKVK